MRNQIFGVELEPDAVDLTALSLALAVCDSLQPNVIWSGLRFDRLRGANLREGDFFEACLPRDRDQPVCAGKFDVVVGNPPFESRLTEPAKRIDAAHATERGAIPDNQIAYLFLDQCLRMLNSNGPPLPNSTFELPLQPSQPFVPELCGQSRSARICA